MKLLSISERAKSLVQFDPERHRLNVAGLNFTIEEAKRVKDWPALEAAVDAKIEEQLRFVWWWTPASGGRASRRKNWPGSRPIL
jgi:hypothetical protein